MNRDETRQLLQLRWRYTQQGLDDATVDAWHEALHTRDAQHCRAAMIAAARNHQRITLAHVVEHLPRRQAETMERYPREPGCTCGESRCELHLERAQRWIARIRAEMAERGQGPLFQIQDSGTPGS